MHRSVEWDLIIDSRFVSSQRDVCDEQEEQKLWNYEIAFQGNEAGWPVLQCLEMIRWNIDSHKPLKMMDEHENAVS